MNKNSQPTGCEKYGGRQAARKNVLCEEMPNDREMKLKKAFGRRG